MNGSKGKGGIPRLEEAGGGTVLIEIPALGPEREGYIRRHINLQLEPEQGKALRRLEETLRTRGERLPGGRPIDSSADAIRWLLEKISAA